MLNKLLVTTALSGLMISSALAQSSTSPSSAPGASPPPAASSSEMKSDAPKASTTGSAATIASQKPDQLLASKLKGADVHGQNDEKIGDVSDILFSKDGKVEAFILSVGGFLGVGAKEVALAPSSIQVMQDKDDWKLKVSMTKDQLAQAPNFERAKDQRTTTGASTPASAPRTAPAGSPPPANRP